MNLRIAVSLIILALVLLAPFYVYLPALLIAILFFPLFLEGIILALLIDSLYGGKSFFFGFPLGMVATVIIIMLLPLRKYIRFNA